MCKKTTPPHQPRPSPALLFLRRSHTHPLPNAHRLAMVVVIWLVRRWWVNDCLCVCVPAYRPLSRALPPRGSVCNIIPNGTASFNRPSGLPALPWPEREGPRGLGHVSIYRQCAAAARDGSLLLLLLSHAHHQSTTPAASCCSLACCAEDLLAR
jgi:hypothetical protein